MRAESDVRGDGLGLGAMSTARNDGDFSALVAFAGGPSRGDPEGTCTGDSTSLRGEGLAFVAAGGAGARGGGGGGDGGGGDGGGGDGGGPSKERSASLPGLCSTGTRPSCTHTDIRSIVRAPSEAEHTVLAPARTRRQGGTRTRSWAVALAPAASRSCTTPRAFAPEAR